MLLLLAACATSPADSAACTPGDVTVSPDTVDLGDLAPGASAIADVVVKNEGDCAVALDNATVDPPDDGLTISRVAGLLAPGTGLTFTVGWAPTHPGTLDATLTLPTDAPGGDLSVALVGTALPDPSIDVAPAEITLDDVAPGCSATQDVTITAGKGGVTVVELEMVGPSSLSVDPDEAENGPLPWTIPPGETRHVTVTFTPVGAPETASGGLVVTSTDPKEPETVQLISASTLDPSPQELSRVFGRPVDIVVALDTTASMVNSGRLTRLDAAWPDFVDALVATGRDYHLALVADPTGCVAGSRPYVPSAVAASLQLHQLREMATGLPDSGDTLFDTVAAATSPALVGAGGCNDGLTRAGATLAVLGITDGEDESSLAWIDFYTTLLGRVSGDATVRIGAVAGDWPSGCDDAEVPNGWYEASMGASVGLYSICDDLSAMLTAAAAALPEPDDPVFELGEPGVEATITVDADGAAFPDWVYDPDAETVTLTASPPAGSTVTVRYVPDACPTP